LWGYLRDVIEITTRQQMLAVRAFYLTVGWIVNEGLYCMMLSI